MDEQEKPKSRLDSLQRDLYSRKKEQVQKRSRRNMRERDFGVGDDWNDEKQQEVTMPRNRPVIKLVLIASLAFFAFSTVFAAYFFFQGADISADNVVIEVQGPAQVAGGEELGLQISIRNNNPVTIESADLIVEYPSGTRSAQNIDRDLPRYRQSLGSIEPGQQVRENVEAVLFGQENSIKNIDIFVEFRVADSNAILVAQTTYDLTLSSSPLSLSIEALEETVSGQEIGFTAVVRSNSSAVVDNVMLEVDYPFGFDFSEATPEPFFANRVWNLGSIEPEEEKEVTFRGVLSGQDGEERVFRFATGIQSENDENEIGARFIDTSQSVFIQRPFITTRLALSGDTQQGFAVSSGGGEVQGEVFWQNNLPTQIFDVEIEVEFSGSALDEGSIDVAQGFYRSIDDKIIYTGETTRELGSVPAGGRGTVGFSFSPLAISSGVPLRNPIIDLDVTVRGKRLSENNVPEEIVSTLSRQVKVSSSLALTSKTLHFSGPFNNTGPMPPEAEEETTYTIVLSVVNTANDVANGTVSMTLPPYVEWAGRISPSSEQVTFTPVGGQIVWNIGEIEAGTGRSLPPRELAFQVRLLPSITQIGDSPILVNTQSITGFDRFTEETLSSSRPPLTTKISDPGVSQGQYSNVAP